jgi:3-phenylpropionate/trans-cinnamate dioxygenase ferredoxin subunit
MDKKINRIKIADNIDEIQFAKNDIALVTIAGKKICLVKTSHGLKACSSQCPHAGGDLAEGIIDKRENIICPVHNYRFNLKNGMDTNNEGYFLKIYKIEKNEEGIFITLENKS